MRVRLILTLLAVAAGAASAQQQPAAASKRGSLDALAPILADADARLALARRIVDELETETARRLKGSRDPQGACAENFSVEAFVRDFGAGLYSKYGVHLLGELYGPLRDHHLFAALKAGDPGLCAPLKAIPFPIDGKPATLEADCRESYRIMSAARAAVQAGKSFAEASCRKIADELEARDCLDAAAYAKAWRAKSAAACGASAGCRFMMGDYGPGAAAERKAAAAVCSQTQDQLTKTYGLAAIQEDHNRRGTELLAALLDVQRRLVSAEAAFPYVPELAVVQEIDSRLETIARLKERHQKSLKALRAPAR